MNLFVDTMHRECDVLLLLRRYGCYLIFLGSKVFTPWFRHKEALTEPGARQRGIKRPLGHSRACGG